MPESNYYIEDRLRRQLFSYLQSTGCTVIPDLLYSGRKYFEIKDEDSFIECIEDKTVRFFIINPLFTFQKLILEENRFIEESKFSIVQRKGGPHLNLACYRGFSEDSVPKIKRTNIHYYPKYINSENYFEEYKAPESLKEYYKNLNKFVRSKCNAVKIGTKSYYLDKDLNGIV